MKKWSERADDCQGRSYKTPVLDSYIYSFTTASLDTNKEYIVSFHTWIY